MPYLTVRGCLRCCSLRRRLEVLDIEGCSEVTDYGIAALTRHCPRSVGERMLDESSPPGSQERGCRAEANLPSVPTLCRHHNRVRRLVLNGLERLTDAFTHGLAVHRPALLPTLADLQLNFCHGISDASVRGTHTHTPAREPYH